MPGIICQFHAAPEEISAFLTDVIQKFDLICVAHRRGPKSILRVQPETIPSIVLAPDCWRIALLVQQVHLPAENELKFIDQNPGCLLLDIGKITDEGLEQSALSTKTEDAESFQIWKKIAYALRKMTKAGVLAVARDGASNLAKTFRYTDGAKRMQDLNIPPILWRGVGCKLRIPD